MAAVQLANLTIANNAPLVLIMGPCVIENKTHCLNLATELKQLCEEVGLGFIFKSSFDKANRTSAKSFRGVGMAEGLAILAEVKQRLKVPVTTDVHQPDQCQQVAEVADILQIPALLCRQTDLLQAAAATGKVVNVKKGQFMAPWDMLQVVNKLEEAMATHNKPSDGEGNPAEGGRVILTERGTSFGYNRLVSDFTSLEVMAQGSTRGSAEGGSTRGSNPEGEPSGNPSDASKDASAGTKAPKGGTTKPSESVPVVFDATHSAQQPAGEGNKSGGSRTNSALLARAATAVGVAGLFMEVHNDPDNAPCDGSTMLRLGGLKPLLSYLKAIDNRTKELLY